MPKEKPSFASIDAEMSNTGRPQERIILTRRKLEAIERRISLDLHVRRYGLVRQYVRGAVLDVACGVGYGSFLLQKNPDVTEVIGVDVSSNTIDHANKHFKTPKTKYICTSIEELSLHPMVIDIGVSLETIEHLRDPMQLVRMYVRNRVRRVILSYPTKKSTHFNPFHYHNFSLDDIRKLFDPRYRIYDTYEYFREFMFVFLEQIDEESVDNVPQKL